MEKLTRSISRSLSRSVSSSVEANKVWGSAGRYESGRRSMRSVQLGVRQGMFSKIKKLFNNLGRSELDGGARISKTRRPSKTSPWDDEFQNRMLSQIYNRTKSSVEH